MITPKRIRERAERLWRSQGPLRAEWTGESCFPIEIPFGKPGSRELLENFAQWREDVKLLKQESKSVRGRGYDLELETVRHRQLGEQMMPKRVLITSIEDLAWLTGQARQLSCWRELVKVLVQAEPLLREWIGTFPLKVLEYADEWPQLLRVVSYFKLHPRPFLYVRQLDIEGVDTKFIERNKKILRELLDAVLPSSEVDFSEKSLDAGGFERRFGLRFDETLIRFRILAATDPGPVDAIALQEWRASYRDLSVPISEFSRSPIPVRRVFIVENKINALAFPEVSDALVIFGSGYAMRVLRQAEWLKEREVHYWGDIDTHGFAILAALRSFLPQANSFLMDRTTLMSFRELWGEEPADKRFLGEIASSLNDEESALFADLRDNRLGERVRLEQERIPFRHVAQALAVL